MDRYSAGSPLSPILHLFYNVELFEGIARLADVDGTGFIDDVGLIAVVDSLSASMVSYISLARLNESSNHLPRLVGRSIALDD